jgi:hypothetical protein
MHIKLYGLSVYNKTRRIAKKIVSVILPAIRKMPYLHYVLRFKLQKVKERGFVDFAHYAQVRRALHEQKFKMKNSDYCSVKINWELFGDIISEKSEMVKVSSGFRHKSTSSTFDPHSNQKVYY